MNQEQRNKLKKVLELIKQAQAMITVVLEEEKASLNDLPETQQGSRRANIMENNCAMVNKAKCSVSDSIDSIGEVI